MFDSAKIEDIIKVDEDEICRYFRHDQIELDDSIDNASINDILWLKHHMEEHEEAWIKGEVEGLGGTARWWMNTVSSMVYDAMDSIIEQVPICRICHKLIPATNKSRHHHHLWYGNPDHPEEVTILICKECHYNINSNEDGFKRYHQANMKTYRQAVELKDKLDEETKHIQKASRLLKKLEKRKYERGYHNARERFTNICIEYGRDIKFLMDDLYDNFPLELAAVPINQNDLRALERIDIIKIDDDKIYPGLLLRYAFMTARRTPKMLLKLMDNIDYGMSHTGKLIRAKKIHDGKDPDAPPDIDLGILGDTRK